MGLPLVLSKTPAENLYVSNQKGNPVKAKS